VGEALTQKQGLRYRYFDTFYLVSEVMSHAALIPFT
jgi:hypothetical protein